MFGGRCDGQAIAASDDGEIAELFELMLLIPL